MAVRAKERERKRAIKARAARSVDYRARGFPGTLALTSN